MELTRMQEHAQNSLIESPDGPMKGQVEEEWGIQGHQVARTRKKNWRTREDEELLEGQQNDRTARKKTSLNQRPFWLV